MAYASRRRVLPFEYSRGGGAGAVPAHLPVAILILRPPAEQRRVHVTHATIGEAAALGTAGRGLLSPWVRRRHSPGVPGDAGGGEGGGRATQGRQGRRVRAIFRVGRKSSDASHHC